MMQILTRASFVLTYVCTLAPAQSVFNWIAVTPASSPPARQLHAMAFDSARGRTVLFGGQGVSGNLADTWEWDGTNWLAAFSTNYPTARHGHALAYDSYRQRTVLFGGGTTSETWEWTGSNWILMSTTGPAARSYHAMAFDTTRQRIVMFGGQGTAGTLGDTWEWDGTTWIQVASSGPSPRSLSAMAFDSLRGKTVLFGGVGGSVTADTWEWDGLSWSSVAVTGPSVSQGHAMVFDSGRGKCVLMRGSAWFQDSWDYDGLAWRQRPISVLAATSFAAAFDSQNARTVMFGGLVSGQPVNLTRLLDAHDTATAATFGTGCGTPPLSFQPDAAHPPISGTTGMATVTNAPTPFGAVMIGLSNTTYGPFPLPVTLGFLGMSGCHLLQSGEIQGWPLSFVSGSTLSFSAFLAPTPTLVGIHLYLQAYVLAPGVNPAELVTSNGIDWFVGNV